MGTLKSRLLLNIFQLPFPLFYNNEKVDIDYITKNTIVDNKLIDIVETVHAINLKDIKI